MINIQKLYLSLQRLTKKGSTMKKTFTLTILLTMLASVSFAQCRLTYDANGLRPGDYRNMKKIEYVSQSETGDYVGALLDHILEGIVYIDYVRYARAVAKGK